VVLSVGIDLELCAQRRAIGVEAAAEDAARAPILTGALPHDYEVAGVIHRCYGKVLTARRVNVDLELAARGPPRRVVALGEDVRSRPVLPRPARPNNDEGAGVVHRD